MLFHFEIEVIDPCLTAVFTISDDIITLISTPTDYVFNSATDSTFILNEAAVMSNILGRRGHPKHTDADIKDCKIF